MFRKYRRSSIKPIRSWWDVARNFIYVILSLFLMLILFIAYLIYTYDHKKTFDSFDNGKVVEKALVLNAQCQSSTIGAGNDKPETYIMELKNTKGKLIFNYETYYLRDAMRIIYEDKVIFDSGCVGTGGFVKEEINYSGNDNKIKIQIAPNCLMKQRGTAWQFSINCQ